MTNTPLNPTELIVDGAPVSDANPLPVSFQPSSATNPPLNPRSVVVNGAEVTSDNPLTVSFG
jgi:hypothetical protein